MKTVVGALSPNIEKDDALLALKIFFRPWIWKNGPAIHQLEKDFSSYLGVKYSFAFNSGRSSLVAIMQSLELSPGGNILVSGFTCNAAVNPIRWSRLVPRFIDIKTDLNISVENLAKAIDADTQGILIQHTFGRPVDMEKIQALTQNHHLLIIEDVAHALGGQFKGKKLGTFGKASFFSLGRDKIISSVSGGIAVTNDEKLAQNIQTFQKRAAHSSYRWIAQQLLHPILTYFVIIPAYEKGELGRRILWILQRLKILTKAVDRKEKRGEKPVCFPGQMPNALAILAKHQFKKLARFNQHRNQIARIYAQGITSPRVIKPTERPGRVYLKYPLILKGKDELADPVLAQLRQEHIILYDGWQNSPIVPSDTKLERVGYTLGTCPEAEKISQRLINLPTHINVSEKQAKKIVFWVQKFITKA